MSDGFEEEDPSFYTPLDTEYSTPVSSIVDLAMSRRELDPTLRGVREVATIPSLSSGLLGDVVPEGFGQTQDGLSTSPGEEDLHQEQAIQESVGIGQAVERDISMPEPVHASTGFRNSVWLSWEGTLGSGRNEGPWRLLPGCSDPLNDLRHA